MVNGFLSLYPALIILFANKLLAKAGFHVGQEIAKVIHIKDYGTLGDGITNDTKAFQKAAVFLNKNGGTLIIDSGMYIVGKQRFSGSYLAGSSYFEEPILEFKNATKPIIIKGYKAILKAADGLKYGFFNPITGLPDGIRKEGNRSSYYATAYIFVNAVGCKSVSVKGLTLDGNSEKLNISRHTRT